jgi:hypothetical protein
MSNPDDWKRLAKLAATDITAAFIEPELFDSLRHLYDAQANLYEAVQALEKEDI